MNTFWLKIAGIVVVVLVLIILVKGLLPSGGTSAPESQAEPKPQTIYEQWEQDDKRLRAEPEAVEPPKASLPAQPGVEPQPVEPRTPQFKKLSMEEEIEAQKKWEWVMTQRKMGRLPVMSYKQMVDTCREIIRRWPDSKYAFDAKRALADLPERYHKMYNITKEETDVSSFYQ
jgi:type IV secretory pathway VirB10-like protein